MRFHPTSFLFGCLVGAGASSLSTRLRPLALEIFTSMYRLGDAVVLRVVRSREGLEDLLAEARARARGWIPAPAPTSGASPTAPPPGGAAAAHP